MWNFAGMCVNADQGRLRISLGAIDDQTLAGFLPTSSLDSPVRWRGCCGALTAMKPQRLLSARRVKISTNPEARRCAMPAMPVFEAYFAIRKVN